jgi:hypothetical protein
MKARKLVLAVTTLGLILLFSGAAQASVVPFLPHW